MISAKTMSNWTPYRIDFSNSPDAWFQEGLSALLIAARRLYKPGERLEMLNVLLDAGADVNAQQKDVSEFRKENSRPAD